MKMTLDSLIDSNMNWNDRTELIVIVDSDMSPDVITCRSARCLFGKRSVFWFKDTVVMLA
jgi:hypothetical protein